jgi:hypothetical protein
MWEYDPEEATRNQECSEAYRFRQLAIDSILAHLTETTPPEHYDQAVLSLQALADIYSNRLDAFHRSPLYGRHRCIDDAFSALRFKILNASLLKPAPQLAPEPPPGPREPLTTPAQVVEDLQESITPRPDETVIGADETEEASP